MPSLSHARAPLQEAASDLLDSRLGIVPRVFQIDREAGSPDFFHYYADACNTEPFTAEPNFSTSGGASHDRDIALGKALGEAVERYCSAIYDRNEMPLVSHDRAPFRCAEPERFALYTPEQHALDGFPFERFDRTAPVRWCPAVDVVTREAVHVPAAMVFVPYHYDVDRGEPRIAQPISTGLACHDSYETASVSAACEAIERDAFTITWQARLEPPRIRAASVGALNRDLLARFARARYEVTLFDITTDIAVPTILSVARHDAPSEPAFVVAAAAHPDARTAVRKCLEELEHTRTWCKTLKRRVDPVPRDRADEISSQVGHLRFWCDQRNAELGSFLFGSANERDLDELPSAGTGDAGAQFVAVVQAVRRANLQFLLTDVTTCDVRDLGLRVVRAIVPGLHPLVVGHRLRALGGRRLYEVPERLGYGAPGDSRPLNTAPHPFP
ncbi:MAG TPA: YcaO-like family protein [Xanthomonadales bacterium]|nr:YcaO-like family protein [Xanthomonadales bacterium]